MDLGAALVAVLTSLGVKLGVLVLGARLLLRLYRARDAARPARLWILLPEDDALEVRILWWSLVLFYASELTCGIEVYVLFESNPYLSVFHGAASALAMGLFALGSYRFFDGRVLRYAERGCALNGVCRGCTIRKQEGCRYRIFLILAATLVALAALYPLRVPAQRLVADTSAYALPFDSLNTWYDESVVPWLMSHVAAYEPTGEAYFIPRSVVAFEYHVLPLVAFAICVASIVALRRRRERLGIELLVFAAGFLCYPYFELILYQTTGDILFGSLGHEIGEFWFLLAAAELLRVSFRPGAGRRSESPG